MKTCGCVRSYWNHALADSEYFLNAADIAFVPIPAKYKKEDSEYVVCFPGNTVSLNGIEEKLNKNAELLNLLSKNGTRHAACNEPLVADGLVRDGKLINPPGQSTSFCAARFREVWKTI